MLVVGAHELISQPDTQVAAHPATHVYTPAPNVLFEITPCHMCHMLLIAAAKAANNTAPAVQC